CDFYIKSKAIIIRWARRSGCRKRHELPLAVKAHRRRAEFSPANLVYRRFGLPWRAGADVADDAGQNVSSSSLGSGVAVRLHPDWHQTENGNQAKAGDTQSESHFNEGKRVEPPQAEFHFL